MFVFLNGLFSGICEGSKIVIKRVYLLLLICVFFLFNCLLDIMLVVITIYTSVFVSNDGVSKYTQASFTYEVRRQLSCDFINKIFHNEASN